MVQQLLRKAVIEKMSSPEQLDMAMRVTSPLSWVALLTLGAMIVAAVVFSIVGQMPVRVDGTGILLRGDSVRTIQVSANGAVREILVKEGESITEGQVVAHLDVPDLEGEIRATEDRIATLSLQEGRDSASVASMLQTYRAQLAQLEIQRRNKQQLVGRGLARRQDVAAIEAQIAATKAQMLQAEISHTGRSNQVDEQRRRLRQLEEQFANNSVIRSKHAGQVAAIMRSPGEVIRAGERLINLEDPKAPFHALVFVPLAEGKRVSPGKMVRVSPSSVKAEEFGFILARVETVSSQPVTFEEVKTTLQNDLLAQQYVRESPFRVRVVPELDPRTPSGFKWTSSMGPPQKVNANTPVTAQIVVVRRRPISYVIPTVRKTLGIGS